MKLKQKAGLLVALMLLSIVAAVGLVGGSGTHTRDVALEPAYGRTDVLKKEAKSADRGFG